MSREGKGPELTLTSHSVLTLQAQTNNPHLAEERGLSSVDDSGINEEDKYGAVVRGKNAYVPPNARSSGAVTPATASSAAGGAEKAKPAASGANGAAADGTPAAKVRCVSYNGMGINDWMADVYLVTLIAPREQPRRELPGLCDE